MPISAWPAVGVEHNHLFLFYISVEFRCSSRLCVPEGRFVSSGQQPRHRRPHPQRKCRRLSRNPHPNHRRPRSRPRPRPNSLSRRTWRRRNHGIRRPQRRLQSLSRRSITFPRSGRFARPWRNANRRGRWSSTSQHRPRRHHRPTDLPRRPLQPLRRPRRATCSRIGEAR
jgi:hypothetical protein